MKRKARWPRFTYEDEPKRSLVSEDVRTFLGIVAGASSVLFAAWMIGTYLI